MAISVFSFQRKPSVVIPVKTGMMTAAFFLSLVLFAGCAGNKSRLKLGQTDQGEVVEAEGLAPYNDKDLIATKRASLVDAQKNAVEKAVGVYVSGKTMVEKAVAIENNILARTDGYVKKYDILSEANEGGLYKTKIRALIALKDLEKDLKDMSLLSAPELRRPRVSVSVDETIDNQADDDTVAENALKQRLIDQGFVVVSGKKDDAAELTVLGKASSYPFETQGLGGFVSYRSRLSVQVTRPGNDQVVLSVTNEASGLGGNPSLAALKSLETVGNLVGGDLAAKLSQLQTRGLTILVTVEGVANFSDVDRIRKHLLSLPDVKDIVLRFFDEGTAQFELQVGKVRAEEIASDLAASQSVKLDVLEAKDQTLRLKFGQ